MDYQIVVEPISLLTWTLGGLDLSRPKKRSFSINGHRTSLSLEEPFWQALREVSQVRGMALAALVSEIDQSRGELGLSSAVRAYLLDYYRMSYAARRENAKED